VAENENYIPEAVAVKKSRRTVQLVWLIPLIAALVGGWLAVKSIMDRGPVITITFKTAEGLEAGKTKIKFKDVDIGLVTEVKVATDLTHVIATAELVKAAARHLDDDTRFWVVRPRISGGTVSGLSTLLSGSYIGMDAGKSGKPRHDFKGLEVPPIILADVPGREFRLHSDNIGSLDVGSPVYFRRLQAGQISGYDLDKNGKGVTLKVFINEPYDRYVNANTRFWQASGIDVTLDATGIKVDTQSVVSILIGGLAFESPTESMDLPPAAAGTEYSLFGNRAEAMKNPDTLIMKTIMVFNESVRGLAVGAPIDFRGIEIGAVTAIKVEINPANQHINIVVEADLYPMRLRSRSLHERPVFNDAERQAFVAGMVERGLRAQLRTGNLLTGQLYVAFDFIRNAPKAKLRSIGSMTEVPTMPSNLRELQETIASIAAKIQAFPLEQLGTDMHQTLQTATRMMQRLDAELAPEAREMLVDARKALGAAERALKPESPLSQDAREAMREIGRAAAAFRVLADYLEQHPEALISGKKEETK
jgi:paraquat-inducible protein B